ncbi:transcriptional regulator [Psychroflexus sp. CAK1W]|uniref:GbsR/MarR family transcriptional regulator n=1 Tax=Psychroflexus curvus TaxID=2873595 RepID=UPI001CCF46AB|nr:transcriptional regulator [Psychroflexus curvus]MBZ9628563.1 transcriptional regulator [Psychroflexus curvus]
MNRNHSSIPMINNNLIEELSLHFEREHKLPPLASKIYSILILSKSETLTFEEIIDFTRASKSSVSNQLNFLIEEGRVNFIFKEDKRKRYFKTKCDYLKKTLELNLEKTEREIEMLSKVIQYKKDEKLNQKHVTLFKDHLESEKKKILDTLKNVEHTSHN